MDAAILHNILTAADSASINGNIVLTPNFGGLVQNMTSRGLDSGLGDGVERLDILELSTDKDNGSTSQVNLVVGIGIIESGNIGLFGIV